MTRHTLAILLATVCLTPAMCGGLIVHPNVVNISAKEYRGGNKNWDIARSPDGITWIANNDGLLEWDGTRWTLHGDAECGLIRSVAVDSLDRVFTGGFEEFGVWERNDKGSLVYRVLSGRLPLTNEDIWKIHVTSGGVYFQSFVRIYFWNGSEVTTIDPDAFILFMQRVGDDFVIHSEDNLLRLSGTELSRLADTYYGGERLNTIRVILPFDDEGGLLLGTSMQGVYILKDGRVTRWNSEIGRILSSADLNCGLRLGSGDYLWGTILGGLYRTDPDGNITGHFDTSGDLDNNTVLSLFSADDRTIWVGLDKGLARLDYGTDFNFFIDHSGTIGSIYTTALHEGNLYLGSNRGLFRVPWSEFSSYNPLSKVRMVEGTQGQVWTLKVVDGMLLCGHNSGMMAVNGDRANFIYRGNGFFDIARLGHREVLASTYSVPMVFGANSSGRWEFVSRLEGFSTPGRFIETDHLGNIWIAHLTKGVWRLRANNNYSQVVSQQEYDRREMGAGGSVKMGRMGGRIVFAAENRFFLYNDIENAMVPWRELNELGVGVREINRMVELGEDHHWLMGKNSVTLLRDNLTRVEIVRRYDLPDYNVTSVDGFENVVTLTEGLSLICLDNGFLLHDLSTMTADASESGRAPILKSAWAVDGEGRVDTLRVMPEKTERIAWRNNNLTFRFACPTGADMVYRIDGISDEWTDVAKDGEIRLERLPAGAYKLRVKAGSEYVYAFRVMPAWWSSGLAKAAYVLAAIGLFWFLWMEERRRLRKRHLRKVAEMEKRFLVRQNELLNLRVRELVDRNIKSDSEWKTFAMHFEQNYAGFFDNVKRRFPGLTPGDLKLCACLRMNLSTKDIASLLSITVRGVEVGRYRLRKKMELDKDVNLNDYFRENF